MYLSIILSIIFILSRGVQELIEPIVTYQNQPVVEIYIYIHTQGKTTPFYLNLSETTLLYFKSNNVVLHLTYKYIYISETTASFRFIPSSSTSSLIPHRHTLSLTLTHSLLSYLLSNSLFSNLNLIWL